jgi:hypothetical protein
MMLKLLPSASSDLNVYTGVVAILIESALPLSLFGLIYASIVVATPKRSTNAYASYLSAFYTFSCLFYAFSVSDYFDPRVTAIDLTLCRRCHHI